MRLSHRFSLSVLVAVVALSMLAVGQQPTSMPPAKTAKVFGQNIRYYEMGEGPVVILLHGTGGSSESWTANIAPLSKDFHVYVLDQIGFGHSDKPLIDYKVATYVDFLDEFMRVTAVPKAAIVGSSTGGWIAVSFAIQHPEMVQKLVLVDSTGLPPVNAPSAVPVKPVDFSYSSLAATRAALERFFYDRRRVTDDLVRRVFERHLQAGDGYTIQRLLSNRAAEYLGDNLKAVRAPTLIVWGKEDSVVPLANAERFRAAIADSQTVVIDQSGHLPAAERPTEFNNTVLGFLRRNP